MTKVCDFYVCILYYVCILFFKGIQLTLTFIGMRIYVNKPYIYAWVRIGKYT